MNPRRLSVAVILVFFTLLTTAPASADLCVSALRVVVGGEGGHVFHYNRLGQPINFHRLPQQH